MARRGINAPFPMAPVQYSAGYMNRIIQTYSSLLAQLQTPGEMRGTTLTLTSLPTAEGSLADGTEGIFFHRKGPKAVGLGS